MSKIKRKKMTDEKYFKVPVLSQSSISKLDDMTCRDWLIDIAKEDDTLSEAMRLGRFFHLAFLEPKKFKKLNELPSFSRTANDKKGLLEYLDKIGEKYLKKHSFIDMLEAIENPEIKQYCIDNFSSEQPKMIEFIKAHKISVTPSDTLDDLRGKLNSINLIKASEKRMILECYDILKNEPVFKLIRKGHSEEAFFGEIAGVPLKGKVDNWFDYDGYAFLIDLKFTEFALTPENINKLSRYYLLQSFIYKNLFHQNMSDKYEYNKIISRYVFINRKTYEYTIIDMPSRMIDLAEDVLVFKIKRAQFVLDKREDIVKSLIKKEVVLDKETKDLKLEESYEVIRVSEWRIESEKERFGIE